MPLNPTATMTFVDYEVLETGVRCHFVSPNPGAGQDSDYYIVLSDVDLAGTTTQAQLAALAKAALNRKLLATGVAATLATLIGQNIILDNSTAPPPDPTTGVYTPLFITPWSLNSIGVELAALAVAAPVSTAWGTNNLARGVPFTLSKTTTLVKACWHNGATLGSNVDVGVYSNTAARLCATGSVAQSGTNTLQEAALTGTLTLTPGRYYLALALSATAGTIFSAAPSVALLKSLGAFQAATSFPLPATATPAVVASAVLPYFGVSLRSLVV
jgi:hypothetical protein